MDHTDIAKLPTLHESESKGANERAPLLGTSRPSSITGFGGAGTRTPRSFASRESEGGFFDGVRHSVGIGNGRNVRRSTTNRLAEEAGITNRWQMYEAL